MLQFLPDFNVFLHSGKIKCFCYNHVKEFEIVLLVSELLDKIVVYSEDVNAKTSKSGIVLLSLFWF